MKSKFLIVIALVFLVLVIGFFNSSDFSCVDSDSDGVCDREDKCLGSLESEPVNAQGCDAFQFCEQFYCSTACFNANFFPIAQKDENVFSVRAMPRKPSCTIVLIHREGTLEPKCVPLECD